MPLAGRPQLLKGGANRSFQHPVPLGGPLALALEGEVAKFSSPLETHSACAQRPHLLILLAVPRLALDQEKGPHLKGERQKDQQLRGNQAVGRPLGGQLPPRAVQAHCRRGGKWQMGGGTEADPVRDRPPLGTPRPTLSPRCFKLGGSRPNVRRMDAASWLGPLCAQVDGHAASTVLPTAAARMVWTRIPNHPQKGRHLAASFPTNMLFEGRHCPPAMAPKASSGTVPVLDFRHKALLFASGSSGENRRTQHGKNFKMASSDYGSINL